MKTVTISMIIYLSEKTLLLLGVCVLCMTNVLSKSMAIIVNVILIAAVFLMRSNIFYAPRNMDSGIFFENKQAMKNDPILWKEMFFFEVPLIVMLSVLVFLIK